MSKFIFMHIPSTRWIKGPFFQGAVVTQVTFVRARGEQWHSPSLVFLALQIQNPSSRFGFQSQLQTQHADPSDPDSRCRFQSPIPDPQSGFWCTFPMHILDSDPKSDSSPNKAAIQIQISVSQPRSRFLFQIHSPDSDCSPNADIVLKEFMWVLLGFTWVQRCPYALIGCCLISKSPHLNQSSIKSECLSIPRVDPFRIRHVDSLRGSACWCPYGSKLWSHLWFRLLFSLWVGPRFGILVFVDGTSFFCLASGGPRFSAFLMDGICFESCFWKSFTKQDCEFGFAFWFCFGLCFFFVFFVLEISFLGFVFPLQFCCNRWFGKRF